MYAARVEKYSVSPDGVRAASFVVTFPRVILAECLTHRANYETWGDDVACYERTADRDISKNSASSRAIPLARMIDKIKADPYMPMWTRVNKGMQGPGVTDGQVIESANGVWLAARDQMIRVAEYLHDALGIHKQDCNRLLEPWGWVTQVVTSSRWGNHFALRCHEKAFPPYRKLARMMYLAMRKATPAELDFGDWHLPFVDEPLNWQPPSLDGMAGHELHPLIKKSAARCAWISYENHDKDASDAAVEKTFNSLFGEVPVHGCYDAQTEVLTADGWKPWPSVNGKELFVTLSKDNKIECQAASRLVAKPYTGPMYAIKTQHADLLVTPGHRMYASRRTKNGFLGWSLLPVEEMKEASHKIRSGGGVWDGRGEWAEGWGQLLGFFIGDGSLSKSGWGRPTFHLRRDRKIKYLHDMANRAGFSVVAGVSDTYKLHCGEPFKEILRGCYDESGEKTIPRHVLVMTATTLSGVYDGLINSDGSISGAGKITYSSTSTRLLGDIQELLLKLDGYASVRMNTMAGESYWGGPKKACWSATVHRGKRNLPRIGWTKELRSKEVSQVEYDGMVYCVTVPNGTLYVRRNGKGAWCGNSPVEHQLTPFAKWDFRWADHLRSNVSGYLQARKLIRHEEITDYRPNEAEIAGWDDVPDDLK